MCVDKFVLRMFDSRGQWSVTLKNRGQSKIPERPGWTAQKS